MANIVTLNYPLSGANVVNTTIDGKETLLDAGIVITNPTEFPNVCTHLLLNRSSPLSGAGLCPVSPCYYCLK